MGSVPSVSPLWHEWEVCAVCAAPASTPTAASTTAIGATSRRSIAPAVVKHRRRIGGTTLIPSVSKTHS
ncbi:hypothetical protein E2562_026865 [Oryza meyeriana var. granulata]|uniref:Uncharacterized protein n=1 Tax=Oryza meyeriana var. granulata TaxID=110450 RepID=A0A6G1D8D8_9ORYZ|nr:hypothetical protein E2562_026865 [Oryza meyeriana var. granulata]